MLQSTREARTSVASLIGADITYFTPTDERRLEPITMAITLAGILLYEFLKSLAGTLGKKLGEATGAALADAISNAIHKLITSGSEEPDIEAAARELSQAVSARQLSADQMATLADQVQSAIEEALVRQHMPRPKARRLAQEVRESALNLKTASTGA